LVCLALVLGFAVTAVPTFAQGVQTATLTGSVTSADGEPLPGVTVTVTSPALIGERSTVSGVNGDYVFKNLPPGSYTVNFSLEGMKTVERTASLPLGGTARSDASLEVTAAEETIVVTGEAPSALETTTVGANFDKETIDALPVNRTPLAIADLAPGLTNNTEVAGGVTINGAMGYDNAILINGTNVQDPIFGRSDNLFIEEAIEETQVLTSGISAEYGGFTGGVVNAITKSGGNQFSGTFRADFNRAEWRDETPFEDGNGTEREGDLNKIYSATLGGPIVRDRLWFFLAGRDPGELETNRTLNFSGDQFSTIQKNERYEVKLTGNITSNHSLQVSYINNDREDTNNVQLRPIEFASVIPRGGFPNEGTAISYNGVFTNNLFGEVRYSEKAFKFDGLGGTGTDLREDSPFYAYGYITGASGLWNAPYFDATDPEDRDNEEIYGALSYFLSSETLGSHDIKVGYEDFTVTRTGGNSQSSTSYVFETDPLLDDAGNLVLGPDGRTVPVWRNGVSELNLYLATRGAELDLQTRSIFVNDRWQLNENWSFNIGARYEAVDSEATGGLSTIDTDALVPRLGASWDPKGDGRWKVDATYAEYAGRYNPSIFGRNSPVGNPLGVYYVYIGPDGEGRDFDVAYDVTNPNVWLPVDAAAPTANVFFEDDTHSPKVEEITLSFGMQLPKGGYAKATFVDRTGKDFVEDFVRVQDGCTDVIVQGINAGCFDNVVFGNSDDAKREYQSLQLQGQYNLTDNWLLAGNWTYQLKNEGNYEGESGQSIGPGILHNRVEVYPENRVAPDGKFNDYQKHKIRLWTNYNFDFGRAGTLGVGLIGNYDSALTFSFTQTSAPTAEMIARDPGYSSLPNFTYFFGERGAGEFDDFYTFDLALNYSVPVWRTVEPFVRFDVRNILNYDDPITWNTTVRADNAGPRDSNGLPTTFTPGPVFGTPTGNANYVVPREYFIAAGIRF
jgi:hypothetical protein